MFDIVTRYGYTVVFVNEEGPTFARDLHDNTVELHDASTDTADVVALNPLDFSGEPQAIVHLPQRLPRQLGAHHVGA